MCTRFNYALNTNTEIGWKLKWPIWEVCVWTD
jgi:hypothetical protein